MNIIKVTQSVIGLRNYKEHEDIYERDKEINGETINNALTVIVRAEKKMKTCKVSEHVWHVQTLDDRTTVLVDETFKKEDTEEKNNKIEDGLIHKERLHAPCTGVIEMLRYLISFS